MDALHSYHVILAVQHNKDPLCAGDLVTTLHISSASQFLSSCYLLLLRCQVDELKSMLQQLGLSNEGGRYVLRDRLMTMLVVRKAATAGDMDHLLQQLSQVCLGALDCSRIPLNQQRAGAAAHPGMFAATCLGVCGSITSPGALMHYHLCCFSCRRWPACHVCHTQHIPDACISA